MKDWSESTAGEHMNTARQREAESGLAQGPRGVAMEEWWDRPRQTLLWPL
jgi:hypothetical protein